MSALQSAIQDRILEVLEYAGVDGIDNDELLLEVCDAVSYGDENAGALEQATSELSARGVIEGIGCSGWRLSMAEWARRIVSAVLVSTAHKPGDREAAEEAVRDLIAGSVQ